MNIDEVSKIAKLVTWVIVGLMTAVQIVPIKINPWTAIARFIGKAINGGDVMTILQTHITDVHRYRILRFNTDLLSNKIQSKEEYDEILYSIDCYEKYCASHPEYKNSRCGIAIKNIEREYEDAMKERRFLEYQERGGNH